MAKLAASLVNLRTEVNARWPHRDKKSDGWIGDKPHQGRVSDHNPDSRGIVHAIDIDRDGINPMAVVSACLRDNWPTKYVIYNRRIWTPANDWRDKPYTGADPHTSHIHVSIKTGTNWEAAKWHWGIATPEPQPAPLPDLGAVDEMNEWRQYFDQSGGQLNTASTGLMNVTALLRDLTG